MDQVFTPSSLNVAAILILKMGVGILLAGAIGLEREIHGRPAGLRTHMLVALGVVLFCVLSTAYPGSDPTRISAQVVTGIGFLGAGTILRLGAEIRGLTSAASIWATAAISMAVARGGPYLIVACVSTGLTIVTLQYVDRIEKKYRPPAQPSEMLVTLESRSDLHDLVEKLNYEGVDVRALRIVRSDPKIQVALQISGPGKTALEVASLLTGVVDARMSEAMP